MPPKVLRVRLPSGATKRIQLADGDTQASVEAQIQALGALDAKPTLFADAAFTKPFALAGAAHGDMVYVHRAVVAASEAGQGDGEWIAAQMAAAADRPRANPKWGAHVMTPEQAPAEDKEERYRKELSKWKGKGMSLAVMEALEALKPQVKPQEKAHIAAVCVDSSAGHAFQAYLGASGFSQHRFGVCYGRVVDDEVQIHAIYEPPQAGDADAYAVEEPADGDGHVAAQRLAELLDLQPVGVVFSARQRKAVLSGRDVVVAASYAQMLTDEQRKAFVVIKVGVVSDEGETAFEAYQVSDLAHELHARDVFAAAEEQKANSGKVVCVKEVLVEGRDAKKVHTEFFLINVPIKAYDASLRVSFPVEGRALRPQKPADIAAVIADESLPFWQRLSDFHLLLYLTGTFAIDGDMPAIVAAIREKRDVEEGYKIMIQSMAGVQ